VKVCAKGTDSLTNNKIPPYSVDAGIDYGCAARVGLQGLTDCEQVCLAWTRLYKNIVEFANSHPIINGHTGLKAHVINFPHDAPEIASNVFPEVESLAKQFCAAFLGP
jgi:hypothetical protein